MAMFDVGDKVVARWDIPGAQARTPVVAPKGEEGWCFSGIYYYNDETGRLIGPVVLVLFDKTGPVETPVSAIEKIDLPDGLSDERPDVALPDPLEEAAREVLSAVVYDAGSGLPGLSVTLPSANGFDVDTDVFIPFNGALIHALASLEAALAALNEGADDE